MTTDQTPDRALRAVLTVTIETRPDGRYYVDCDDLLSHVIPWVEGTLEGRDVIVGVTVAEAPLSPDYEHPECGFHWHGRDGMDIPVRDGQPVCPRCELRRVEKLLAHRERRCQELREECLRRGKNVLAGSLKIVALERQLDEVRSQLGAEVMRAGQAEAELRRVAAEEQAAADEVDVDLTDGPVRCPLCPNTVTLHTPSGARAHFTAVHPEQRITGRGPGPWPLLVTDGDEAHPDAARPAVGEQPANVHDAAQQPSAERPRCPHCQLPHDLTPDSLPAAVCASTRQRIADAAQAHTVGDHSGCCRVDCDVLQAVGEQPETQETQHVELRARYRVQLRDNDADDWKPSEPRVDYETRDAADESAAASRQHFPSREYRVVTRTTTITEQP